MLLIKPPQDDEGDSDTIMLRQHENLKNPNFPYPSYVISNYGFFFKRIADKEKVLLCVEGKDLGFFLLCN